MQKFLLSIMLMTGALMNSILGSEQMPPLPDNAPRWDLMSLFKVVRPLNEPLSGRIPIFLWNMPEYSYDDSGKFRYEVNELNRRGISVLPQFGDNTDVHRLNSQVRLALMAQEIGQPVFLLYNKTFQPGGNEKLWPNENMWIPPINDGKYGSDKSWPILPLANTSYAADKMRNMLNTFKSAGVEVTGLFSDQENLPNPWNGIYWSQTTPAAQKHYDDPSILANTKSFNIYVLNLRAKVLREIFAVPLQEFWPNAFYGNYGDVSTNSNQEYIVQNNNSIPNGVRIPDKVSQPVCYPHQGHLLSNIAADVIPDQKMADNVFFYLMFRSASTALINKAPGELCIPYISRASCHSSYDNKVRHFGISPELFREFLRHCFLRGADGFIIYNLGFYRGGYMVTPQQSFESIDDVVAVYNELLPYREYIEKGIPMNFSVPHMNSQQGIWSGLSLGDKCLIRIASMGDTPNELNIYINDELGAHTLSAMHQGAYYIIKKGEKPIMIKKGFISN